MPRSVIGTFSVEHLSILDEAGNVDEALMPELSDAEIKRIYELLVIARTFDQRALSLQREGRIGTYPSILGQEAAQVGSAFAIEKSDWVFPSFRETGMQLTLGYPIRLLFQYWGGDERGLRTPDDLNIFPISVSVGTQIPHAVGAAMAAKYRKDETAVITYFGDGGTSKGDFHEGLNMAGIFQPPLVLICQNNQWAISVPLERQTAARTLAQKAIAYGFEGIQVDGNDVFAVYLATKAAIRKAKEGGGPTLIECFTYRMGDHTTADDAARYRSEEEMGIWRAKDPILRLERFMEKKGEWSPAYKKEAEARAASLIDAAVQAAEAVEQPKPQDMFDYTFAELSQRQRRQREEIAEQ